ncbi:type I restriction enzyme R subunit [Bacilli bacterium PM5-9]|nr:type I restriction enzyme R subunit [Bacilli bacterium PM5-9]
MAIKFTSENEIEDKLIKQLVDGESQWKYRPDLNTEDKLWNNFRLKLEQNNKDVLNDVKLTEKEFTQIKDQLNFPNFFEASKWLAGENGVAVVTILREDASLGTIRLKVLSRRDIAGGMSSYEIINQYHASKESSVDRSRRFDITLLINGLPMIQIELKNRAHSYMDAFRQIKKYLVQGKFKGIFSSLQMFVVSNATETKYIAAAVDSKLNEQFLSTWVDENNRPVNNYLEFAKHVLSIPQAHKMVSHYTVIDSSKKSLVLLRPYQIHAIEAIKQASKEQKNGFIWHTTGSGKTLTSYKVARNLLDIPAIDKTIFIVDRVDLDQQTSSSFISYAENDTIAIDETDNVKDLISKLLSVDRNVIVTTIQKLNHILSRFEKHPDEIKQKKLKDLRVAIIVDECHRAVSELKQKDVKKLLPKSYWYGFTGTPIFPEQKKKGKSGKIVTTEDQYGNCLHKYTVKEAMHDKAVLGFQMTYRGLSEEAKYNYFEKNHPDKDYYSIDEIEKEAIIDNSSIYDTKDHMLSVIDYIINKSKRILGFSNGVGRTYGAILTTSSIAKAQRYYSLFKEVIAGNNDDVKVNEDIKKTISDFPKIAITYSISENEESSIDNQREMEKSIQDYNEMFKTNYSLETIRGYNQDINNRLARKQDKFQVRKEQLDLIIVVDRLLTGFDAPSISTLFIDRAPLEYHNLIQAFSRTNRIFDKAKPYGQIVTFQSPKIFKCNVNKAMELYSNGDDGEVIAPLWEEAAKRFEKSVNELKNVAMTPQSVIDLDLIKKKKFLKCFQILDRNYALIQLYEEFDNISLFSCFGISNDEIQEYYGIYVNIKEELKTEKEEIEEVEIDFDYELETVGVEKIDYEYILKLIQVYVDEPQIKESNEDFDEISQYIINLKDDNKEFAEVIDLLWEDIQKEPETYKGMQITNVLEERIQDKKNKYIQNFSKEWHVNEEALLYVVDNYNPNRSVQNGEKELKDTSDYEEYKISSSNSVSKLHYWQEIKKEYNKLAAEIIYPLNKRK